MLGSWASLEERASGPRGASRQERDLRQQKQALIPSSSSISRSFFFQLWKPVLIDGNLLLVEEDLGIWGYEPRFDLICMYFKGLEGPGWEMLDPGLHDQLPIPDDEEFEFFSPITHWPGTLLHALHN